MGTNESEANKGRPTVVVYAKRFRSHLNTTSSGIGGITLSMYCSVLFQDRPCDLCSRLRPGRNTTVGRPERRQLMQGKGFLFVSFYLCT